MKLLKVYLVVVTTILILAIGLGVYVWYTIQKLNTDMRTVYDVPPTKSIPVPETAQESTQVENNSKATPEPIVVKTSDLTSAQQVILEGFGYSQDTFTITPAMISCAEDAVGKTRLQEILDGSAPSALESIKLLPCFK